MGIFDKLRGKKNQDQTSKAAEHSKDSAIKPAAEHDPQSAANTGADSAEQEGLSPYYISESPQMLEAYEKARSSFKYFWREMSWEHRRIVPAVEVSSVKAMFHQENEQGERMTEHMWIADIEFDGIRIKGVLANAPDRLTNIDEGAAVELPVCEITDWLFSIDGRAYGGFTVQVIRAAMDEEERRQHDEAWGLDFGSTSPVLVAYGQEEHPEYLREHPMCLNMEDSLKDFLTQHPEEITRKDERAYTMLHRETIAGNKTCVELLLAMGADADAKTADGCTALDFARRMEWEHIIACFDQK